MTNLSTHVLDTAAGRPGAGIAVTVTRLDGSAEVLVGEGVTDGDGRIEDLADELRSGRYRIAFDTGGYGNEFFPQVIIEVALEAGVRHYHVPLLLSPFGYSTYRGS